MQPTTRRWVDAALILVLAAATALWSNVPLTFTHPDEKLLYTFGSVEAWRAHVFWWCLIGVPAAVAIPLRHRWPLTAMLLAAGSATGHLLDPIMKAPPMDIAVLVTMYTLAGSAHTRRTVVGVLIAAEALLFTGGLASRFGLLPGTGGGSPVTGYGRMAKTATAILRGDAVPIALDVVRSVSVPALLLAATWAVADSARTRRAHLATLQARADDLEREQEQRTALAVAAERGRITRELHDVVAHGLSVMVVQAQGAKAMLTREPDRTEAALANIVVTGRASLAEMRRLLGLVRTGTDLTPQPGLATLPGLVDGVRDSGTPIDFRVTGEPPTLPAVVELAAYRIVQEALTNALKHATPGASCTVALDFDPTGLTIRVADTGDPVPQPVPGNGLRGITERVHALGGELRAGPAPGGFEVWARLPVAATQPRELVA
ncbi:histidine kinase [Dactylosporangium sp. AC04546]|uniref:sensor histidine kinase n=1 Tax=Dactylosporangium sp. AC04546 TaxID=2862460 RepID=UPI001EE056B5|nr:histidine kinase [Dactylosporangium sp. AC04546]WVK79444.1 histidine kinase [Dactylosporangium sp. AC04546]